MGYIGGRYPPAQFELEIVIFSLVEIGLCFMVQQKKFKSQKNAKAPKRKRRF